MLLYAVPGPGADDLHLHGCPACGFAFLVDTPLVDESYEGDCYFFRPWMEPINRRLASRRWRELSAAIEGRALIDVGCGQGAFLRAARQAGLDARGIEPNARVAQQASADSGAEVVVGKVAQVDGLEGSADTVVSFDVVEHERDPVAFLEHVRRLLKPGGLAIVETPHFGHWSRKLMGRNWYAFNQYHVSMLTPETLRLAASKAGLEWLRHETPHVGLGQVLCRLLYDVGLRSFVRVLLLNDRADVYAAAGRPARGILRRVAGAMVYRRGPLNAAVQKLGLGDKLRAFLRRGE